jgi:hypothetical protein
MSASMSGALHSPVSRFSENPFRPLESHLFGKPTSSEFSMSDLDYRRFQEGLAVDANRRRSCKGSLAVQHCLGAELA